MHPFGGPQYCPNCTKPVYAAEQVIGPARKLYHKSCLTCTSCNKRLDSYALVEHDQKPYCKNCHIKNFSTRDLRHANLPYATPPPDDNESELVTDNQSPIRPTFTGSNTYLPRLRPTRTLATSPLSPTFSPSSLPQEHHDSEDDTAPPLEDNPSNDQPSYPSNTSRPGIGTIPRTVPLIPRHRASQSIESVSSQGESTHDITPPLSHNQPSLSSDINISPLKPTATGTRYGAALMGSSIGVHMTGSPRKWGATNPQCGRCGKSVYFAEQVKAVGKTFHKFCLRCTECGTTLDSNRLRDHDGDPFCVRCYSKLHGPQGSGYALLGKAGA